jgi:hypothetical protein
LRWQTEALLAREVTRAGHVVHVRPELVVEVEFNDVQRSSRYPGGLALRHARVVRYRDDKRAAEADPIAAVWAIARADGVVASLIGFGLVAIGGCALKCPEDSTARAVSVGTAATMGALLGLAITWALIDCLFVSGLGSPGCRD